jgi:hypothetical protein
MNTDPKHCKNTVGLPDGGGPGLLLVRTELTAVFTALRLIVASQAQLGLASDTIIVNKLGIFP